MTDTLRNPTTSSNFYTDPEFQLAVDKGIDQMLDNYRRYIGGSLEVFEMHFMVDDPLHYCQLVALREEFGLPHSEQPTVFETAEGAKLYISYWQPTDASNPDDQPTVSMVTYSTSDRFVKFFSPSSTAEA